MSALQATLQLQLDCSVGPNNVPQSSSDWLASLGLQQYSAAFFAAGYGDTDTLSGLSRKHINEMALFQKGGIPSAHIKLLLEASKQFQSRQLGQPHQLQSLQQPPSGHPLQPPASSLGHVHQHAAVGTSVQTQPASQSPALSRLHQVRLDNTASSCTSASSFDSGYDTEDLSAQASLDSTTDLLHPGDAPTALVPPINYAATSQQQSRTAQASAARDGPSQQHLQQLYSEMQEDYQRLQQLHPAPKRFLAADRSSTSNSAHVNSSQSKLQQLPPASSKFEAANRSAAPESFPVSSNQGKLLQPGVQAQGLPTSKRQGPFTGQPGTNAKAASKSGEAIPAVSEGAVGTARRQDAAVQGPSLDTRGGRAPAAAQAEPDQGRSKAETSEKRAAPASSAAEVVQQMWKRRLKQPGEPFVHVYTNFHTLSKVLHTNAGLDNTSRTHTRCPCSHMQHTFVELLSVSTHAL